MTEDTTSAVVDRVDTDNRYIIRVGDQTAGFASFRDRDGQRVFHHTETYDTFAGQGMGSRLVREALNDTRASGLRIVPVCPFVSSYLTKHEEFGDITDPVTDDVIDWLEGEVE